jgi:hypothetical protein
LWSFAQGGPSRRQERFEHLLARTSFFRADFFERGEMLDRYAEDEKANRFVRSIITNTALKEAVRRLYGVPRSAVIVPDAVYGNILLPGQELILHTDVPEFRGISREELPVWLLTAMKNSGLFQRWELRIATAVIPLPSRSMKINEQHVDGTAKSHAGALIFFPGSLRDPPSAAPTRLNTAVVLDTDSVYHGVLAHDGAAYPPSEMSSGPGSDTDLYAQKFGRTILGRLRFDESEEAFALDRDGRRGRPKFPWDDVRLSLSAKWLVFADEAEAEAARARGDPGDSDDALSPERVFDIFESDLRTRHGVETNRSDHLAFANEIVQTYAMPYAPPLANINVCMLIHLVGELIGTRVQEIIARLMSPLCRA